MKRSSLKERLTDKKSAGSLTDTIVALASAQGFGAVALIRLSGPEAWTVARRMILDKGKFDRLKPRNTALLTLVHSRSTVELDTSLVVKYKGPESFTGEDVVEFQCHGGVAVPAAVCEAALAAGARQAGAGEFTRRAFLSGKIDLAQAEAVDALVHARSEEGRRLAYSTLKGELSKEVENLRERLLELKAEVEYSLDFPEEEPLADLEKRIESAVKNVKSSISRLLQGARDNIVIGRGIITVIAGAPNVGKSSLFNRLLGRARAIVTEQAGTTRDAIEMECLIEGLLFRLVDTAGLRTGGDTAERIGIEYGRKFIEEADLILFVREAGRNISRVEKKFLEANLGRNLIPIVNKIDLVPAETVKPDGYLLVSAKEGTGLEKLRESMVRTIKLPVFGKKNIAGPEVTTIRQKNLLDSAYKILDGINLSHSSEYVAADLQEATDRLGEITGRITSEDVLERIFSNFCIGK